MRNIIITFSILLLSGCASSSLTACNLERLQHLGAITAMSGGKSEAHSGRYSCSDEAPLAYQLGFESGLKKYCTYDQGLLEGEHGKAPVQQCSDARWDQYRQGFLTGREIRATHQRLENIASQLTLVRKHLSEVQSYAGTGPLSKIDHERINTLRADIAVLSAERDAANRRLFTLQSSFENSRQRELSSL